MTGRSLSAALACVSLLAAAPSARAQAGAAPRQCILAYTALNPQGTLKLDALPTPEGEPKKYNLFLGGGAKYECQGQGNQILADSTEYYGLTGLLVLIGNVHYTEARAKVDSRRMTYYRLEDRLVAEGDVNAVLNNGTTMKGPRAEYYRAIPGARREKLIATGRPHMSLAVADSSGRPAEPTQVVANTVVADGDSLVYASGQVQISRTDIDATGDSAFLDGSKEFARLMRNPTVTGKGTRAFKLTGDVIDTYSRQRQVERVVSSRRATAVSNDLTLRSDTIDLRVVANKLNHAFAWGPSRAHVTSPERTITADSLDVSLPEQRLREVHAVRKAFAETITDSTKFRTKDKDWIRGDTIVARFDSIAPTDTVTRPRIREAVASGSASSLYHLAPQQRDSLFRPAINYVRGRLITLDFRDQQVQTVTVLDQATGVYVEPGAATRTSGAGAEPSAAPGAPRRIPGATRRPGNGRP